MEGSKMSYIDSKGRYVMTDEEKKKEKETKKCGCPKGYKCLCNYHPSEEKVGIINSLLDTDWYKISMGQVVLFFFPSATAEYRFILREDVEFPEGFDIKLKEEIAHMATLQLSPTEYEWLASNPNIYRYYLDWFKNYRFNPNEVYIGFENKKLDIRILGSWKSAIYWEVPLLAAISELYFSMTGQNISSRMVLDRILDYKAEPMVGMPFIEFGTRRRLSFEAQNQVINAFLNSKAKDDIKGTSNPYFAMKYIIPVVGTYAHEAVMAMQSIWDVSSCDSDWLGYWKVLYGKSLNIALTDTISTEYFLKTVEDTMFHMLDGFRQDSGDPIKIGWQMVDKWKLLGIDPKTKSIVFSDNLNPAKARAIWDEFKDITNVVFGVGTNFTNDFGPKPLNMVIKMVSMNGIPVVKLSDEPGKHTGDAETIEHVTSELKLF
jgi:nicotinate phosphoribosyltransferase